MTANRTTGAATPTPSEHLAASVRRLRTERRLSQIELARAMEDLGRPIGGRIGLQRLERGERKVDVEELVTLARVFNVPPVALLFPVGHAEATELSPGEHVEPWTAAKWFCGEEPLGDGLQPPEAGDLNRFRQHDRLVAKLARAEADQELGGDDADRSKAERQRKTAARDLRVLRVEIRRHGLEPPPVQSSTETFE